MVAISIFDEVPDGMGATSADLIDVYVYPDLSIRFASGEYVSHYALTRRGNRKPILLGQLKARLANVQEKILSLDSGATIFRGSSMARGIVRESLRKNTRRLERGIARVERVKA